MIMETNWLGSKTVCYFRFCPKDREVPINKDAANVAVTHSVLTRTDTAEGRYFGLKSLLMCLLTVRQREFYKWKDGTFTARI
jgi:hypothetical protein